MDFYQELSRHYDEIFPARKGDFSFFKDKLKGQKKLLDVGCGTGNKTVLFQDLFQEIIAFDLDSGMIEQAKEKHGASNIEYLVQGMEEISNLKENNFDTVFCLGNTLVHLDSLSIIKNFFKDLKKICSSDVKLLVQILNYNKIMREKITDLPIIETANLSFFRSYSWVNEELHFITTLNLKSSNTTLHNDIILLPLLQEDLTASIVEAGFAEPEYFGNFKGDPHTDNSLPTIAFSHT